MHISTLIPTKNEEARIGPLLDALRSYGAGEVIVSDGGSTDRTREIASAKGVKTIVDTGGLAAQLNAAAREASGQGVFFLPADSTLLCNPYPAIERALSNPKIVGGGFSLDLGGEIRWKILSLGANFRAARMGLPMGDQGIFLWRDSFLRIGGFRNGPLLPDLDLMDRARDLGRVVVLREKLRSSPRRYEENGLLRNWLANQMLLAAHLRFPDRAPKWAEGLLKRLRHR